ncbi:MAG: ATP-dependent metallopeptidase FtsH/Yme1/Tma family protein, partial [Brevundimonas sp.]|uniref:ATP-dependent metallopeptidase FtsH/Yme1/Tma family protein n=1 Tax=Brevundimonas sp. TaxID=1871086 RepID=UPI00273661B5
MGNARNIAFWVVLFLLILALFNAFGGSQTTTASRSVSYSEFIQRVEKGEVAAVTIDGERVVATDNSGARFATVAPADPRLTERLIEKGVEVRAEPQESSGFMSLLSLWLPFIVLIGIWIFFMNRMQGGG